ncbi:MAG: hypothetical protein JWN03_7153, partial [Nocardia sp.]|nr:hypothetical protein [Nocardia sp.]
GSNSIEGYVVETDDAAAAVDYEEALTADERTFAEIRGYRQALGYVRIRRHGYLARAGIDERTASRDLKALTEIGLLSARGETRARHYVAGDKLLDLKLHLREDVPRTIVDPYPRLRAELLEP